MRSIRTKIMVVLFAAVLATTVILIAISSLFMSQLNENDSNVVLKYIGESNALRINRTLDSIQHSVDSVYYYANDRAEGQFEELRDNLTARERYISAVQDIALSEAGNSDDIKVVYFRTAKELGAPEGFLYQYYEGTGNLERRLLTPIDIYDRDDFEHVGWYYAPIDAGEPTWLGPYDNYNLKMRMISYEVPLYVDGELLGLVGMDMDVSALSRELSEIRIYQTGSAMLFDGQDNLVYQKNHIRGLSREKFSEEDVEILEAAKRSAETGETVTYGDSETKLSGIRLSNGMLLAITAPLEEINEAQDREMQASIIAGIAILLVVTFITWLLISSFLRPLRELTSAAKQLSDGNMEISLKYHSKDEVGTLSDTFAMMAESLKKYFDHFHGLAYTDNLTGLNNKAAFEMIRDVVESEIKMGRASFQVIVMDVNNLKTINDTIGHEMGDELLKHVALVMRKAFVGFPLYRIGGDEFCSIINKTTNIEELIYRLQSIAAETSEEDFPLFHVHYQIAAGGSTYQKGDTFQEVFNRADKLMYENKKLLKEQEKNKEKTEEA